MSLNVEGQDCPVCGSHLFNDDDVVFCPICGAPHHRDCYKSIGHCALEADHGTEREYKRPEPKAEQPEEKTDERPRVCAVCGEKLSESALYCPKCGRSTTAQAQNRQPFAGMQGMVIDPMGGVDPNDTIEEIPVTHVAKYVMVNTHRYIPVFKKLSKQRRIHWNWAAFLFPGGWLCYRKCYKQAFIFIILAIFCAVLNFPTQLVLDTLPIPSDGMVTYSQIMQIVSENIDQFMGLPWITAALSTVLNLLTRALCGMFGDFMYRQNALDKIRALQKQEEYPENLPQAGAVSLIGLCLAMAAVNWIPVFLLMFL